MNLLTARFVSRSFVPPLNRAQARRRRTRSGKLTSRGQTGTDRAEMWGNIFLKAWLERQHQQRHQQHHNDPQVELQLKLEPEPEQFELFQFGAPLCTRGLPERVVCTSMLSSSCWCTRGLPERVVYTCRLSSMRWCTRGLRERVV